MSMSVDRYRYCHHHILAFLDENEPTTIDSLNFLQVILTCNEDTSQSTSSTSILFTADFGRALQEKNPLLVSTEFFVQLSSVCMNFLVRFRIEQIFRSTLFIL